MCGHKIKILKWVLFILLSGLFVPIVFATNGVNIEGNPGDEKLGITINGESFPIEISVVNTTEEDVIDPETGESIAQGKRKKIYDAFIKKEGEPENKIITWIQEETLEIKDLMLKALKRCGGLKIFVYNNETSFWLGQAWPDPEAEKGCYIEIDIQDLEDIVKNNKQNKEKGKDRAISQMGLNYVILHEILHLAALEDNWQTRDFTEVNRQKKEIQNLQNDIAQKEEEVENLIKDKDALTQEIERFAQDLERLSLRKAELRATRKKLETTSKQDSKTIDAIKTTIGSLVKEIRNLESLEEKGEIQKNKQNLLSLNNLNDQINAKNDEIAESKNKLEEPKEALTALYLPFQGDTVRTVNKVREYNKSIPRNSYNREGDGKIYFGVEGDYLDREEAGKQASETIGGPTTNNKSNFCGIPEFPCVTETPTTEGLGIPSSLSTGVSRSDPSGPGLNKITPDSSSDIIRPVFAPKTETGEPLLSLPAPRALFSFIKNMFQSGFSGTGESKKLEKDIKDTETLINNPDADTSEVENQINANKKTILENIKDTIPFFKDNIAQFQKYEKTLAREVGTIGAAETARVKGWPPEQREIEDLLKRSSGSNKNFEDTKSANNTLNSWMEDDATRNTILKPGLITALESKDKDVREQAAERLGSIGGDEVITALKRALEFEENAIVRRIILESLVLIGSKEQNTDVLNLVMRELLLVYLNDSEDPTGQLWAITILRDYFEGEDIERILSEAGRDTTIRDTTQNKNSEHVKRAALNASFKMAQERERRENKYPATPLLGEAQTEDVTPTESQPLTPEEVEELNTLIKALESQKIKEEEEEGQFLANKTNDEIIAGWAWRDSITFTEGSGSIDIEAEKTPGETKADVEIGLEGMTITFYQPLKDLFEKADGPTRKRIYTAFINKIISSKDKALHNRMESMLAGIYWTLSDDEKKEFRDALGNALVREDLSQMSAETLANLAVALVYQESTSLTNPDLAGLKWLSGILSTLSKSPHPNAINSMISIIRRYVVHRQWSLDAYGKLWKDIFWTLRFLSGITDRLEISEASHKDLEFLLGWLSSPNKVKEREAKLKQDQTPKKTFQQAILEFIEKLKGWRGGGSDEEGEESEEREESEESKKLRIFKTKVEEASQKESWAYDLFGLYSEATTDEERDAVIRAFRAVLWNLHESGAEEKEEEAKLTIANWVLGVLRAQSAPTESSDAALHFEGLANSVFDALPTLDLLSIFFSSNVSDEIRNTATNILVKRAKDDEVERGLITSQFVGALNTGNPTKVVVAAVEALGQIGGDGADEKLSNQILEDLKALEKSTEPMPAERDNVFEFIYYLFAGSSGEDTYTSRFSALYGSSENTKQVYIKVYRVLSEIERKNKEPETSEESKAQPSQDEMFGQKEGEDIIFTDVSPVTPKLKVSEKPEVKGMTETIGTIRAAFEDAKDFLKGIATGILSRPTRTEEERKNDAARREIERIIGEEAKLKEKLSEQLRLLPSEEADEIIKKVLDEISNILNPQTESLQGAAPGYDSPEKLPGAFDQGRGEDNIFTEIAPKQPPLLPPKKPRTRTRAETGEVLTPPKGILQDPSGGDLLQTNRPPGPLPQWLEGVDAGIAFETRKTTETKGSFRRFLNTVRDFLNRIALRKIDAPAIDVPAFEPSEEEKKLDEQTRFTTEEEKLLEMLRVVGE